ncbi:carbohydrate kinase [Gordonia sp. ABSL1-1]|uniref:carbohydrate kinase family protein n=1 Tax=Gordonia sp. ABSL1-1 TaxID=3053923 RepID=UPI0025727B4F|nr:carbohydrate kinase [Gordonia sp. ABSL1-1]MDL9938020.1 carbohydrate kinase [Gordonia sp. ABSL1-1]
MREIVVCGEALVDVVADAAPKSGGSGPLPTLRPALGGGPFNVAVALGRLGSAVSFLSSVSTDDYGDAIVNTLRANGVGVGLVQRCDQPTSLALATVAADGGAHYTFYVDGTADRLVADPGRLPATVTAMCFGTLSLVLEPGASVYEALLHRSHADGRLTVLDPNIRPTVIADADGYRQRFRSWMPSTDVVKVSDEDAAWLAVGPCGSAPADWLSDGVTAVVVTAGAAGILVHTRAGSVQVSAPAVEVVDTIGAGDAALGGVLSRLDQLSSLCPAAVRELSLPQWESVAEFAVQVAAVAVTRPGADPPWASECRSD